MKAINKLLIAVESMALTVLRVKGPHLRSREPSREPRTHINAVKEANDKPLIASSHDHHRRTDAFGNAGGRMGFFGSLVWLSGSCSGDTFEYFARVSAIVNTVSEFTRWNKMLKKVE